MGTPLFLVVEVGHCHAAGPRDGEDYRLIQRGAVWEEPRISALPIWLVAGTQPGRCTGAGPALCPPGSHRHILAAPSPLRPLDSAHGNPRQDPGGRQGLGRGFPGTEMEASTLLTPLHVGGPPRLPSSAPSHTPVLSQSTLLEISAFPALARVRSQSRPVPQAQTSVCRSLRPLTGPRWRTSSQGKAAQV